MKLALRPTVPARERYYANPRPARRGNAPLRQTGSTAGPVFCGAAYAASDGARARASVQARIVSSAWSRCGSGAHADALPGRGALDQSVLGHALLGLEGRAVPPPVDVHGHAQQLPSSRHRPGKPLGVEAAALVRPAVRIQACIERGACGVGNCDGDRRPGPGRNRSARSADDHLQCRSRPIVGRPLGAATPARVLLAGHEDEARA